MVRFPVNTMRAMQIVRLVVDRIGCAKTSPRTAQQGRWSVGGAGPVEPTVSALSLLGIIRHPAFWERRWFQVIVAGGTFPGEWPESQDEGVLDTFGLEDTFPADSQTLVTESLFDAVGGERGVHRLAVAWHVRVMADEVVSRAFSHGFRADHIDRLAAYLGEAWGGPTVYSDGIGGVSLRSCGCTAATALTGAWTNGPSPVSTMP